MAAVIEYDPAIRRRGLTREQYDLLVEAGALEGESVELLEGRIVEMPPQGASHATVASRLGWLLTDGLGSRHGRAYAVRQHSPLATSSGSEPEPDLAIVDATSQSLTAHPGTAHLVVEVAASSQRTDPLYKPRIYAEAGVAEYWVVDLPAHEVVVHAHPYGGDDPGYREVRRVGAGAELTVLGVEVRLADLLR